MLIQKLRSLKNKKGFTMIELIVVIAIIAILIAILAPNMLAFIETAERSTANANARSIYMSALAYYTERIANPTDPNNNIKLDDIGYDEGVLPYTGGSTTKKFQDMLADMKSGVFFVDVDNDGKPLSTKWKKSATATYEGTYPLTPEPEPEP